MRLRQTEEAVPDELREPPDSQASADELGPSVIGNLLLFTAEPTDRALAGWHQGDLYIYTFGGVSERCERSAESREEEP